MINPIDVENVTDEQLKIVSKEMYEELTENKGEDDNECDTKIHK